jgi:hypothetical protein
MNEQGQRALLGEYVHFYDDIPFSEQKMPGCRYYYDNDWYGYSDAIFLYSWTPPKTKCESSADLIHSVMSEAGCEHGRSGAGIF